MTTIPEEILLSNDCVDTAGGQTLEQLEEVLSNNPCKYKLYSIIDDRTI